MKKGDLLWQRRSPGGVCIHLGWLKNLAGYRWGEHDNPLWVLHPTEGLIQDADYYYGTLDEEIKRCEKIWLEKSKEKNA